MRTYPKVLSIAGSDCSGGAGIQADLKTFSALGVYGMSVITALTAQNTMAVTDVVPTPAEHLAKELDAIFSDIRPDAIKIGMSVNAEIINVIADKLIEYNATNIILDPVMISTSGHHLIGQEAISTLTQRLMPICTLLTPNRHEAECLADMQITSEADVGVVAKRILNYAPAVLIKGGHFEDDSVKDYLFRRGEECPMEFAAHRVNTNNTHGTGCTLSSAIAAYVALGHDLVESVALAKRYLTNAIISGSDIIIGNGHGPVNHLWDTKPMTIIEK